jgi:hypothetical protein
MVQATQQGERSKRLQVHYRLWDRKPVRYRNVQGRVMVCHFIREAREYALAHGFPGVRVKCGR